MLLERYFNRELSLLSFNERVLEGAFDSSYPLFEQIRYLSLADDNLDEFYMVRVAGLKSQLASGVTREVHGQEVNALLQEISSRTRNFIKRQELAWKHLSKKLNDEHIYIQSISELGPKQKKWLTDYFLNNIFPVLTPFLYGPAHPFPLIPSKGIGIALKILRQGEEKYQHAIILVPTSLKRFIRLPGEEIQYVLLEDCIFSFMESIFPDAQIIEQGVFRVLRDNEVEVEDEAEDLLQHIEIVLKSRRRGNVISLVVSQSIPENLEKFLSDRLQVHAHDLFKVDNFMGFADCEQLITAERSDLMFPKYNARYPTRIKNYGGDHFAAIRRKDILVHHPYESFDVFIQFLHQAAVDPHVIMIKQTLYRTGYDSPVVDALLKAVDNGKTVVALVEIRARFDEEVNIQFARDLERAGVQVIYGDVDIKTHAKICLVVREEEDGIRRYFHFGTGNYHPLNAKVYTDLSLFTCDPQITSDANAIFNFITGAIKPPELRKLAYSPNNIRMVLTHHIKKEIHNAKEGKPAHIWIKCNSLVDNKMTDLLYQASKAGVKVDLIVRGACCLRPGVKGLSENITVKSIVGRFLEHSRIYCFGNGKADFSPETIVYIASADIMTRNLDFRIEAMLPIENPTVHQQITTEIMSSFMKDTANSWILAPDGTYTKNDKAEPHFNAHKYFMETHSLSGEGTRY